MIDFVPGLEGVVAFETQITEPGRAVMEAATTDLVEAGFGLSMLDDADRDQLFGVLRRVRLAKGDFLDGETEARSAES